jgi:hypothetical protein
LHHDFLEKTNERAGSGKEQMEHFDAPQIRAMIPF